MLPETIVKGDDVTFTMTDTLFQGQAEREMVVAIYHDGNPESKRTWEGTLQNDTFTFELPGEETDRLPVGDYVLSAYYTKPVRKTLPAVYCSIVQHQVNSDIKRVRSIIDQLTNTIEKRIANDVVSYSVDGNTVTRNDLDQLDSQLAKWKRELKRLEQHQRIQAGGKISNQVLLSLPKRFR